MRGGVTREAGQRHPALLLQVRDVYHPLKGVLPDEHLKMGIVHHERSNFVCFRSREEAHRAYRDRLVTGIVARLLQIRVVQ